MKILLLNTSESTGGAAVAANRLLKALRKQGVDATMLVRDKQTSDQHVVSVGNRWLDRFRFIWERLVIFCCNRFSRKNLFQVSVANTGRHIARHPLVKQADIIHLHWINQGFLSLSDLSELLQTGKPIVWTLHDMWPSTAICHYAGACRQYQESCRECRLLSNRPLWNLAYQVFCKKQNLELSKIYFVGCSRWITTLCRSSSLLLGASFQSIPNPIDRGVFSPRDKGTSRRKRGLPLGKYLLLFAAAKLSDSRKGISYLIDACRLLSSRRSDIEILFMGSHVEEIKGMFPYPVHALGYVSEPEQIAEVYALSDLFVTPSLEDNLPNTLMESLACGTPCVGFRVGGIPEMIDHLENGYVADYQSAEDLAKGIEWVLDHPEKEHLRQACIEKLKRCYSEEVVARQYMDLYNRLLKKAD